MEQLESRQLLTIDLVSVSPGAPPDDLFAGLNNTPGDPPASQSPMISGNGRFVAFHSKASNLVDTDSNAAHDVFVRDLELGVTTLISRNSGGDDSGIGETFNGASVYPTISDNGRFVTFASFATNLIPGQTVERIPNVYVHDRDVDADGIFDEPGDSTTRLLSVAKDGTAAGFSGLTIFGGGAEFRPMITPDGSFVSFASGAADLAVTQTTPGGEEIADLNARYDIIRAAVDGSTLEYLSLNALGTATQTHPLGITTGTLSASRDGGTVAYRSNGFDIVETVPENFFQWSHNVFVSRGGKSTLVSINSDGDNGGNGNSIAPFVSGDGRHVAFVSRATNLDSSITDDNSGGDVFVRDLMNDRTTLVSRSAVDPTKSANGSSPPSIAIRNNFAAGPTLSDDGRFVVFASRASDLIDPALGIVDGNLRPDIYVYDRDSDVDGVFDEPGATQMMLVSVNDATNAAGVSGFFGASNPAISPNGRFIAFATDTEILNGVVGMHVYVRDMALGQTFLISENAAPAGGPVAAGSDSDFNLSMSTFTSRIAEMAFVSMAANADPNVSDTNAGVDVFAFRPSTDIVVGRNFATGYDTHAQWISTLFEDSDPYELGYYQSIDRTFDGPGVDPLIGARAVTSSAALAADSVERIETILGKALIELPGIVAEDTLTDYFILSVADPSNLIEEWDSDPFNEDNTAVLRGLYHVPEGPVMVHGSASNDSMRALTTATELQFDYGSENLGLPSVFEYDLPKVTETRVRLHEGDDTFLGGELKDVVFGGAGNDTIRTAGGDDTILGGDGNDILFGGPGNDIIYDGMGDDTINGGPGDDIIFSTPGSDDIFISGGGLDTLDFSFADQAISIDLDLDDAQTVDEDLNSIDLDGIWDRVFGTNFDDIFAVSPTPFPRELDGGKGNDTIVVDLGGLLHIDDGAAIRFPGTPFAEIRYKGFESKQLVNRVLMGDATGDGQIDFSDFLILSEAFGKSSQGGSRDGDFDQDGEVGFSDFLLLSQNFGKKLEEFPNPRPHDVDVIFSETSEDGSSVNTSTEVAQPAGEQLDTSP